MQGKFFELGLNFFQMLLAYNPFENDRSSYNRKRLPLFHREKHRLLPDHDFPSRFRVFANDLEEPKHACPKPYHGPCPICEF